MAPKPATKSDGPPSLMVRKFMLGGAWEPNPAYDYRASSTKPLFFYGTLMDPSTLARVIKSDTKPVLRPAKIFGRYTCKLWGPYPALVETEGPTDADAGADANAAVAVDGMVYEPKGQYDRMMVAEYETENYAPVSCRIVLADGVEKDGLTFAWVGERSLLKEGRFDLRDWLQRRVEAG